MEEKLLPCVTFALVFVFHVVLASIPTKRKGNPAEEALAREARQLLREANALSTPSTFAKSAKLKRLAAAKEKELAQMRQSHASGQHLPIHLRFMFPTLLKAIFYTVLMYWLWGSTIATVPSWYLQPFGRLLAWRSKNDDQDFLTIGIMPWLLLCSKVSAFLSSKHVPCKS